MLPCPSSPCCMYLFKCCGTFALGSLALLELRQPHSYSPTSQVFSWKPMRLSWQAVIGSGALWMTTATFVLGDTPTACNRLHYFGRLEVDHIGCPTMLRECGDVVPRSGGRAPSGIFCPCEEVAARPPMAVKPTKTSESVISSCLHMSWWHVSCGSEFSAWNSRGIRGWIRSWRERVAPHFWWFIRARCRQRDVVSSRCVLQVIRRCAEDQAWGLRCKRAGISSALGSNASARKEASCDFPGWRLAVEALRRRPCSRAVEG